MTIWWAMLFMGIGAGLSEWYHARMWKRYREGKNEGRRYADDTRQRYTIRK